MEVVSRPHQVWILFLRGFSMIALFLWALELAAAIQPVGHPFPGFTFESNLLVTTNRPPGWNGTTAGLVSYDRLLTANGKPLLTPQDLDHLASSVPLGTPIVYELLRGTTQHRVVVRTQTFGWPEFRASQLLFLSSGFGYLLIGVIAFWMRPQVPAAQAHLFLTVMGGLFMSGIPLNNLFHGYQWLFLSDMVWIQGAFFHLAAVFPEPKGPFRRHPWLNALWYLPSLVITVLIMARFRSVGQAADPVMVDGYFLLLNGWLIGFLAGVAAFIGASLWVSLRAPFRSHRNQATIVLLGSILSFLPIVLLYALPLFTGHAGSITNAQVVLEFVALHVFPISIAYAIVRHHLFDIQLVVRRATLYLTLILSLGALYGLVVAFGHHLLETRLPTHTSLGLTGFVAALFLALAIRPLHDTLRQRIDRLFLGKRADALQLLTDFNHQATPDSLVLAQRLVALLRDAFDPRWIGLWVDGRLLASHGDLPALEPPPRDLGRGLDDGALCLANPQEFLVLGPRANDMPYNSEEAALFTALGAQARLAFDHARLFQAQLHLSIQEGIVREVAKEREQLLRQVVHDLGSDIFSIALGLRLLDRPADQERARDSIHRSLAHMQDLLEEKSAYLRQGRAERQALLGTVLPHVREAVAPILDARQQILEVLGLEDEAMVSLSELELEQVLVNLLTNASKFSAEGSTVRLALGCEPPCLVIQVVDEGLGIPAAFMERIATGARAHPEIPGSGFGLQNVKAILEKAGGKLSWRNGDQGAVFEVRLACARSGSCPVLLENAPNGTSSAAGWQ